MAKALQRPIAVFRFRKYRSVPNFIGKVDAVINTMEDKPLVYPSPKPTLAVAKTHLAALNDAQGKASSRKLGLAAARDTKYTVVVKDVLALLRYVQELADAVEPVKAVAIITGSGFELKHKAPRTKVPFTVKHGNGTGNVRLIAVAAAKRASYNWQMSLDGVRWTDLPTTIKANTVANGLTEGKKYFFRYRAITKEGEGGWSNAVYIIVQ